jgi:signal transduction histidine kinase
MRWPTANRTLGVYLALSAAFLGVAGWQLQEHQRFSRNASQALVNRGRDITSTLGVVVRSQRRLGGLVLKRSIESALQDLIRPGELESIASLGSTGETIASAGKPVAITPEMIRTRAIHWQQKTLTLMNLMDLGSVGGEEHARPATAIVVPDPRAFRPPGARRPSELRPPPDGATPAPSDGPPAPPQFRSPFGRPSWMTPEEYESVIQKQGVHSLVVVLSTAEMHRLVFNDLLLRSTVSLMAAAAALVSALAWRNTRRTSELQIRLVKAGEMNTHLSEMNFAAAGLAHETRNPLNLIRGLAQMVAMEARDSPKLKEHAATIIEEADRVTVQLNEFIHYSKPREAHPAPVDLVRLVSDVTRTLQPDLEEKQVQLQQPEDPLTIEADEALLRQALFNLLLNAVQAVGTGGRISIRHHPGRPGEASLEIRDDGPGVPAAERAAIFKPYVTMRPKGAGLGLAIVHQIVLAHGWDIVCEANEPRGAVFRIGRLKITGSPPA